MSKRQTLSERFDSLGPPKYDDMIDGQNAEAFDADNQSDNNDTTFTVVNRTAATVGHGRESRNQRISQVMDNTAPIVVPVPNHNYSATRAPGNRGFRRDLNPSPYHSPQLRQSFRTNRVTASPVYKPRSNEFENAPRLNVINGNNYRGAMRGQSQMKRRGFGMNTSIRGARTGFSIGGRGGGVRESPAARINADRKSSNRGNRGRGRGTAPTAARGRGRGSATKAKGSSGGALTEKQLDRELEQYYGNKDPQKLKEIKNDQLDREMDEYWKTQDENGHNETKSSKTDKAENNNSDNAQRNKSKSNTNDNVSKKSSE